MTRPLPRPRPNDDPHAWIGDVAVIVFWPLFGIVVLVLLALSFLRLVGLAS